MTQVHMHDPAPGTLPHPALLKAYEDILPGSAKALFDDAKRALDYDMEMDRMVITERIRSIRRGEWLGFAAFLVLIICASLFAAFGNNIVAFAFLGASALNVVGQFLRRTSGRPD